MNYSLIPIFVMAGIDVVFGAFITIMLLLFNEVRIVIYTIIRIITRPVPKFNKYLGMTKAEYHYNLDSDNRNFWLSMTKLIAIIILIILEIWWIYATFKPGTIMPLEWILESGAFHSDLSCCGLMWLVLMLHFYLIEKFPYWRDLTYREDN